MQIKKIAILGGAGFVGRTLANRLAGDGYALRILTRNRERNRSKLILLPNTELIQTDIHDPIALEQQLAGCDAVINLVGILNERGSKGRGFHHAHVALMEKLLAACQSVGIKRLLQMSALNADAVHGSSHYLRSKGEAEDKAHAAAGMQVTSFRPSVIFGPDDSFFNRFAGLLRLAPVYFPLACAQARFAPVYVGDVAEAFACSLEEPDSHGRRIELCGSEIYTLQELVQYTARHCGIRRVIIPLPDWLARTQALLFDLAGFAFYAIGVEKPFSMDNYLSTKRDSVCQARDAQTSARQRTSIDAIVPAYLAGQSQRQRYQQFRKQARRE